MNIFKRKTFDFSDKNIPIQKEERYFKDIIHQVEALLSKVRWKAFFFFKKDDDSEKSESESENEEEKMTFGFKTPRSPPFVKELSSFEKAIWGLIESIKFTKYRNPFQKKLSSEIRQINESKDIFMKADKTRNYYETKPEMYNKLLHDNITSAYKKSEGDTV